MPAAGQTCWPHACPDVGLQGPSCTELLLTDGEGSDCEEPTTAHPPWVSKSSVQEQAQLAGCWGFQVSLQHALLLLPRNGAVVSHSPCSPQHSHRHPEADIPARHHPASSKDQAAAGASKGSRPSELQHLQADPSTAAAGQPQSFESSFAQQHRAGPPMTSAPHGNNYAPSFPQADNHTAQQAAAFMAATAAANMRAAQGAAVGGAYGQPGSNEPVQYHQQHQQQQQQQGPPQLGSPGLPEAAPALKTDPVELSLLIKYLQIVRQTQVRVAAVQPLSNALPATPGASCAVVSVR